MAIFHVGDLSWYLEQNAAGVVDYQSWKRRGWRISTSAVEDTVNRLIGDTGPRADRKILQNQ